MKAALLSEMYFCAIRNYVPCSKQRRRRLLSFSRVLIMVRLDQILKCKINSVRQIPSCANLSTPVARRHHWYFLLEFHSLVFDGGSMFQVWVVLCAAPRTNSTCAYETITQHSFTVIFIYLELRT